MVVNLSYFFQLRNEKFFVIFEQQILVRMQNHNNFPEQACSCGNDKSDSKIQHKCEYSGFGQILYWIGISAIPVRVNFICSKCGEVVESTDDPNILKQFVGR
jgi:hypothetical protein